MHGGHAVTYMSQIEQRRESAAKIKKLGWLTEGIDQIKADREQASREARMVLRMVDYRSLSPSLRLLDTTPSSMHCTCTDSR